jgi:4'-phosphopantetheinyl transferase
VLPATVWIIDGDGVTDAALASYSGWLNAAEQARYRGFVRPLRQRQFLIGRVLLRLALGELLDLPPPQLRLVERAGRSPQLDMPGLQAGFSLSHSGPWVACAVCAQGALGLDIELPQAQRDVAALASQSFDADDVAWLAAQPAIEPAFYQRWCRNEARIKLASNSDGPASPCDIVLAHPALTIALCSTQPVQVAVRQPLIS